MITLYKGDDTGGQLGKNVKIVFHCDDGVDMSDVTVKFDLLGIVKREFTDVHDGDILDIFISHAESRKFPLGVIFAKMWGEDSSGKLRTFANRIPFRITLNLMCVYGSDGTDTQDIHVYSSVEWDSIANKPTTFPSTIGLVEGLEEALSGKASAESVEEILAKIPSDASAQNQLADKEWVDGQVESVAAYYITFDAQGSNFPTHAALINAQTYYSGGAPRVPTRNDYAVVLADETHEGAEYRYIFAKPEGSTVGQWEAQYPIESVITFDDSVTCTSPNAVRSSGIWSAIWGALTALPTGFTSLYDWVISRLGLKRDYTDLSYDTQVTVSAPALHAILTSRGSQVLECYLPCTEDIPATPAINHVYTWRNDGAEFYITQGVSVYSTVWILYGSGGEQLATTTTDNANDGWFPNLTFIVSANSEVTTTKVNSYPSEIHDTLALNSEVPTSLPWSAITDKPQNYTPSAHASTHASNGSDPITPSSIGAVPTSLTVNGTPLTGNVTLTGEVIPLAEGGDSVSDEIRARALDSVTIDGVIMTLAEGIAKAIAKIGIPAFDLTATYAVGAKVVYGNAVWNCTTAVSTAGAWTGTTNWTKLFDLDTGAPASGGTKLITNGQAYTEFAKYLQLTGGTMTGALHIRYGFLYVESSTGDAQYIVEWMSAYDAWALKIKPENSDTPYYIIFPNTGGTLAFTAGTGHAGNLAALDAQGNPTDSGVKPSAKLDSTSAAPAYSASATYSVGDHVTYNGALYVCSTAISTAEAWNSAHWTADTMTDPDATLDVTATDKLLRLVSTNGDVIWGQGYNLSTTSSATVLTEQVSAFTFAADAAADQAIVLPSVAAGKVGDFILDVTNLSANDRSLTLTGLDSAFSVVVKAGDDLSETLTVAAGEMARYYFTMTAFRVNSLPTWQVAKEAVENGGAQS